MFAYVEPEIVFYRILYVGIKFIIGLKFSLSVSSVNEGDPFSVQYYQFSYRLLILFFFIRAIVESTGTDSDEDAWAAYMNTSQRKPFQEIQRQHTYANIRQRIRTISLSYYPVPGSS
jgi:hypothetical protein